MSLPEWLLSAAVLKDPSMPAASTLLSPQLLAQLENMELVSRKIFRGRMKGKRRSRRKGQSVEFADFRNYVPGDDLRFIERVFATAEFVSHRQVLEIDDFRVSHAGVSGCDARQARERVEAQHIK